ncbi:MAG: hypothetical protein A2X58_05855 [Nitrospirae bacterium GWC2_56_14]|nr:MAG: hypothetical protein A2X58_05855 [Nitrospirae bacterium GWC2_56_14]
MNRLLLPVFFLLLLLTIIAHASTIQPPQSGQTTIYSATDDGDMRAGNPWPAPRFSDNRNGTIVDNLTGLFWCRDADLMKGRDTRFDSDGTAGDGAITWQHALEYIKKLNVENYLGFNDWRLPNLNELASLVHQGQAAKRSGLRVKDTSTSSEGCTGRRAVACSSRNRPGRCTSKPVPYPRLKKNNLHTSGQ